jgi:hypothetical protein
MNRLLLVATLLLGIVGAHAQSDLLLMGVGTAPKSGTPAGFQGPGDITSGAIAFYSAGRAYNAAYAAAQSPLTDIVDTATGLATCTIKVGTNGFANVSAVVCPTGAPVVSVTTFCTVTHIGCSIAKLYDQTGNGNHVVQATLANMPGLTLSAQNGLPCAVGTGAGYLVSAGNITQAVPYTVTAVGERTNNVTTAQRIITNGANIGRHTWTPAANTVAYDATTAVSLTAADGAFHAMLGITSASAPLFAVDSSANTSTSTNGTTALSSTEEVMATGVAGSPILPGNFFCEAGIWPADLNASYQAILANMRSAVYGWNF